MKKQPRNKSSFKRDRRDDRGQQQTRRNNNGPQHHRRPAAVASPEPSGNDEADQAEFIYGKHAVLEYVKSGDPRSVNKIFMQKGLHGELASKVVDFSQQHKLVLQEVPKSRLDELTADGNHQGVLLTLAPYQYAEVADILAKAKAADEAPLILILDNLNDPHNLGSILRTADAVGVHGVIIPKRRAVGVTAVVAKTATGALEHVLVARVTNLTATINDLKAQGIWVFGTAMAGEDYRTWNSRGPVALVIGNEGKGISPLVAKTVDGMVTIPMIGHVQSLNASVATSILLYHMFDQRHPVNGGTEA